MGVTKEDLDRTYAAFKSKHGGLKEDYFAALYLAEQFGRRFEDVAHQVAFGNNDFGIDAFYLDREARNLYLYQFKWSENHHLFKESLQRVARDGIDRIFGNPLQVNDQNDLLHQLKTSLFENRALVDRVLIQFVFNGDPEAAEASKVLGDLREDLEKKKFLIDRCFEGREVALSFEYLSNTTRRRRPAIVRKTHHYPLTLSSPIQISAKAGQTVHVAFVPLLELHDMYREMRERLFEKNIRAGLAGERAPNRAIRSALERIARGEKDPAEFAFSHNGVTLHAERIEFDNDQAKLTEPRVLNGAQTITSVGRFLEDNEKNRALERGRSELAQVRVLAKILTSCTDDFVTSITIDTNRQNPVAAWNLRASDPMQLQLEDKFREELKIFYERQEDAFLALTDEDLQGRRIEQHKAIKLLKLAQTFLAAQGEIDRMSRMTEVFEQENWYQGTFRESYLKTDARRILLAYKIHLRLTRILREISERGTNKYAYITKARDLVWALLIQGVLNDSRLEALLEHYGTTLVAEADFFERIKDLAASKVRLILSDAFKEERHRVLIRDGKYGFLKARATYQHCMMVANERYGWSRLAL